MNRRIVSLIVGTAFSLMMMLPFFAVVPITVEAQSPLVSTNGEWNIETVDSPGEVGEYTSIALDSSNKAHISYFDVIHWDLKYATNAGGSWITTTVDSDDTVGWWTSIALDSSNKAHISYYDVTYNALKYATNAEGSWVTTTVDSTGEAGIYSSLALDSSNKVHISYLEGASGNLKYATNAGGSWITTIVDSTGEGSKYTSIALDSSNKVHISYYDDTNGDLKYATNAGGSWSNTTLDSTDDVGGYTSVAIDSNDKIHISYSDETNGDLKYATNAGGSWNYQTLDSSGDVGALTSIAIDSNEKIHISYFDRTNGDLKYATNAGGSWSNTTVDSTDSVGRFTSIALDSSNKVHISYYDDTNGDLKYATDTGLPSAPRGLTAVSGNGFINLNWTAPSYLGQGTLTYRVYRDDAPVYDGSATSHHDAGLAKGVSHWYKAAARNEAGWGPNCTAIQSAATGVPDAPRELTAAARDGLVELQWTWPVYAGPGILTYHLFRDGADIWGGTARLYTDDTVTNGITYSYTVAASNSIGWGDNCTAVQATPESGDYVPTTPRGLTAASGNSYVELNWTEPSYVGPGEITYHLFRNESEVWSGTELEYNDTSVTNLVVYSYKVAAENSIGWGANCTAVQATPLPGEMKPTAPRNLTASTGDSYVNLTWEAPANAGETSIIKYNIYRGTLPPLTYYANVTGTVTWFNDTDAINGVTYQYCIKAVNAEGEGEPSNIASAIPKGRPSAPLSFETVAGDGYVNLTWSPPTDDGGSPILYYKILRNPVPSPAVPWTINASTGITWYNDTSVENGVTYNYYVIASNEVGEGEESMSTATPQAEGGGGVDAALVAGIAIVAVVAVVGAAVFFVIKSRK